MSNIFKNAYFGKPYKTRGGDKALFQYKDTCQAHLITESEHIDVYLDGIIDSRFFDTNLDIVSEWQEEINKKDLEELAEREYPYEYYTSLHGEGEAEYKNDLREAFKNGYLKAKRL